MPYEAFKHALTLRVTELVRDLYDEHGEVDGALIAEKHGEDIARLFGPHWISEVFTQGTKAHGWFDDACRDGLTMWYQNWLQRNDIEAGCAAELTAELWAARDGEEASIYKDRENIAQLHEEAAKFSTYWAECFQAVQPLVGIGTIANPTP